MEVGVGASRLEILSFYFILLVLLVLLLILGRRPFLAFSSGLMV